MLRGEKLSRKEKFLLFNSAFFSKQVLFILLELRSFHCVSVACICYDTEKEKHLIYEKLPIDAPNILHNIFLLLWLLQMFTCTQKLLANSERTVSLFCVNL